MEGEKKDCQGGVFRGGESHAFGVIVSVVAVVWFVWCFVLWVFVDKLTGLGQLGDSFGALNVLLTGLAFAAVYHQLKLQKHEIWMLENNIKEARKAEEIRAQPYLVFSPQSAQSQTDYILMSIPFRNFRALATEVNLTSDSLDCEVSTSERSVILSREHMDGSVSARSVITLVLRNAARDRYLSSPPNFQDTFRISYRDELGSVQNRLLMLTAFDKSQFTIQLAEGWSWDVPRAQGEHRA